MSHEIGAADHLVSWLIGKAETPLTVDDDNAIRDRLKRQANSASYLLLLLCSLLTCRDVAVANSDPLVRWHDMNIDPNSSPMIKEVKVISQTGCHGGS